MKSLLAVLTLFMFISVSANAGTIKTYKIIPECQMGEVAVAKNMISQTGDGGFAIQVSCKLADCYIQLPKNNIYQVALIEARLSFVDMQASMKLPSLKSIGNIKAPNKAEANEEAQKFVRQGFCQKTVIQSAFGNI